MKHFDDPTMPDVDDVARTIGLMAKSEGETLYIGEHKIARMGLYGEWNIVKTEADGSSAGDQQYELNLSIHFEFAAHRKLDEAYKVEIRQAGQDKFAGKVWQFMSQDGQSKFQLTMQPEGLTWTRLILKSAKRTLDGRYVSCDDSDDDPVRNFTHIYFLLQRLTPTSQC